VTPEDAPLDEPLLRWLTLDAHDVDGWAPEPPLPELRCHPDLVERLAEIARPVRGVCRAWVEGAPVVHHPAGAPIACATGTSRLLVRSGEPAGALTSRWRASGLPPDWVDLDPWASDVTFARAIELLRAHIRRAFERIATR
jgi:hypothetical protein